MPDTHSNASITQQKAALRATLRAARQTIPDRDKALAADQLKTIVSQLPEWASATRVALYHPLAEEISPLAIASLCKAQNKAVFLPVIEQHNMAFALWDANTDLQKNQFNIPEPPASALRCELSELDICFLPLVGWDRNGARLGMGGGFYDRALENKGAVICVGLGFDCQESPNLPTAKFDIKMDYIATESALIKAL